MAKIVLYTDYYPFGNSETFLETEIIFLRNFFEVIYIQPLNKGPQTRDLPQEAVLLNPIESRSCSRIKMFLLGILNMKVLLTEKTLRSYIKKYSFAKSLKYTGYGIWLKNMIKKSMINDVDIHYSYWMNSAAFSLAMLKREKEIKVFVSRVHRYDLYVGEGETALDFMKAFTLEYCDRIFFISETGRKYLGRLFNQYYSIFCVSRLGTLKRRILNPINKSDVHVIVSCSYIKPLKRIDKILEAIIILNSNAKDLKMIWYHFGSGENIEILKDTSDYQLKGTNIKCVFTGNVSNTFILDFYENQPVDFFINFSEIEGVPYSIMEAQSFGIPVIATNAGGTGEIVNNLNGVLLNVDTTSEQLAEVIHQNLVDQGDYLNKRKETLNTWELQSNGNKNYSEFSHEILSLCNSYQIRR